MIKLNNVTFTYRSETGGGIREIDLSIPGRSSYSAAKAAAERRR